MILFDFAGAGYRRLPIRPFAPGYVLDRVAVCAHTPGILRRDNSPSPLGPLVEGGEIIGKIAFTRGALTAYAKSVDSAL